MTIRHGIFGMTVLVMCASLAAAKLLQRGDLAAALGVSAIPASEVDPMAPAYDFAVTLTNRTNKPIAAYALDVVTTRSDGRKASGVVIEDLVPSYAGVARSAPVTSRWVHLGPLRPLGQRFKLAGPVEAPPNTLPPTGFSVRMIVFDDNTYMGDHILAKQIFATHAGAAAEIRELLGEFRSSLGLNQRDFLIAMRDRLTHRAGTQESSGRSIPEDRWITSGRTPIRTLLADELRQVLNRHPTDSVQLSDWVRRKISCLSDQLADFESHSAPKADL